MATTFDKASLVMIPSGVKEDKLYSIKPTDGSGDFTFSRGSDIQATRVNSSGLIEKAKVNLTSWSNDLDNWIKDNTSVTSGQAGYDGTNDAWRIDSTGGFARRDATFSGVVTHSIYAKAGTAVGIRVRLDAATDANYYFNLSTGAEISHTGIALKANDLGGGWYRLEFAADITTGINHRIYPVDATGTSTTGNIFVQDSQINHGLIAQDYVETTTTAVVEGLTADLPRLDYSGGASCSSLLLEPSRTNIVTQSEYFGAGTSWVKLNGSVTDNASLSPEGENNASKFIPDVTSGVHALRSNLFNQSATAAHSWFVKADGYSKIAVRESELVGNYASFNLATGTIISTNQTADIEDYGNGWYRCTLIDTTTGINAQTSIVVLPDSYTTGDPIINWSGDGTKGVLAYGVQVELGSYKTSYIPTYSAAANRGLEYYANNSATDLIGQTEGVLFLDFTPNTDIVSTKWLAFLGSGTDYIGIYGVNGTNKIRLEVGDGGTQATFDTTNAIVEGQRYKCAIAYANNDFVAYVNGVQVGTDSSGSVPATSTIRTYYNLSSIDSTDTHQLLLFKTRLTNAELAALTTI